MNLGENVTLHIGRLTRRHAGFVTDMLGLRGCGLEKCAYDQAYFIHVKILQ